MGFADRHDAGRQLGEEVARLGLEDPVVVALPRGGVPVAAEVARRLGAPLDVLVVRKLGCPWQPELGIGAIAEGDTRVLNRDLIERLGIGEPEIEAVAERELEELERRVRRYRGDRQRVPIEGRTVVLVDDGVATGFTARAAISVLREHGARRVGLALPVAPPETVASLRQVADNVICLETPEWFMAIGAHYDDFRQTSDAEVQALLAELAGQEPQLEPASASPDGGGSSGGRSKHGSAGIPRQVEVDAGPVRLPGMLRVPDDATGVVVFVHGSGSGRFSPRNTAVARSLNAVGLATLLFDLLTPDEAAERQNVFDIDLLTARLADTTRWLATRPEAASLPVGYFGASTGAAAALRAAAELGDSIAAVVARGGRPDLAAPRLADVTAPTLLIVGGNDTGVLETNRDAAAQLRCEHELQIVPGAGHLFEEPGALDVVADLAGEWFAQHLRAGARGASAQERTGRQ